MAIRTATIGKTVAHASRRPELIPVVTALSLISGFSDGWPSITLKKTDTDYSPTTMYRDYALNPELFHWESQSTTNSSSPTGQRYINHRRIGSHVLLFVREAKTSPFGASPYAFLGPADYVTHEGSRPMAVTWRLRKPMPTEIFIASRAAVA
ncbi:MAG: DUF3427 domain-containing protein [Mycobacterium sp.]|nr:DUF3427 domain-containing protein [Mycobacterium sp.]